MAPVPTILSALQWHLDKIKFWQAGNPSASAPLIAVVDSGVDYTHKDLVGRVINGEDFANNDLDAMDDNGQGTAVAGIAAANGRAGYGAVGVSPTSQILAVKVFDQNGSADNFTIWQGWIYARDYPGVKVINFSGGGWAPEDSASFDMEKSIVADIVARGIVFVCAAGDSYDLLLFQTQGFDNYRPIPAYFSGALTVAASEELDNRCHFSNFNLGSFGGLGFYYNFVKIVAPGQKILSCTPYPRRYGWYSGTSMASAMVAWWPGRPRESWPNFRATLPHRCSRS